MTRIYLQDGELRDQVEGFWKTPYNYDRDAESIATGLECKDPTMAQQHMAAECDGL